MKKLIFTLLVPAFMMVSVAAYAATATSPLTVTANVVGNCTINTVADIAFSNYDPTDPTANETGAGDFVFRCTKNTTYGYYISGVRTMTDGADTLNYELYSDAGRTTVFDSASVGTPNTAPDNTAQTVNIYGRVAALQDVGVSAAYTGTVTITIEY